MRRDVQKIKVEQKLYPVFDPIPVKKPSLWQRIKKAFFRAPVKPKPPANRNPLDKYVGQKFHSDYFGEDFTVLYVEDDDHWVFKLDSGRTFNAETKLSSFVFEQR